jgi:hypothetical protein
VSGRIRVDLTPAQLRVVNAALARLEAEEVDEDENIRLDVLQRTRRVVWDAMTRSGVKP